MNNQFKDNADPNAGSVRLRGRYDMDKVHEAILRAAEIRENLPVVDLGLVSIVASRVQSDARAEGATTMQAELAAISVLNVISPIHDKLKTGQEDSHCDAVGLTEVTGQMVAVASRAYWQAKGEGKNEDEIAGAMSKAQADNFDDNGQYIGPQSKPAAAWKYIKSLMGSQPA